MTAQRSLRWDTAIDLTGFSADLGKIESLADRVAGQVSARLATIKAPALDLGGGGGAAASAGAEAGQGLADGITSALSTVGGQVQAGMVAALAPLGANFARIGAQFETMAGFVLATNRRLDNEVKFEKIQGALSKVRTVSSTVLGAVSAKARATAANLDQDLGSAKWVNRFAAGVDLAGRVLDRTFGAGKWLHKFSADLAAMGSLSKKAAQEVKKIHAPAVDLGFLGKLSGVTPMMKGVAASADRASASFKTFGIQALAALGFVGLGYKAVGFLSNGIKGASDLNEAVNKTNVLLGQSAPAITAFADRMATDFGFAKADTLGVSTAIAGLGKGLGKLDGADLTKFTLDLTQLAGDVGSINNMEIKDVGAAFRIGLSGEQSDVLKQLGVVLTETTVKSYALAHGIGKAGQELTEQQKVQARAGIIMEKLAFANGDLANTVGDPANAYRKFAGSLRNLATEIGGALMPAVKTVLGLANGAVARLAAGFRAVQPAVEWLGSALAAGFTRAAAAVDYVLPAVASLGSTLFGAVRSGVAGIASFLPSFGSIATAGRGLFTTLTMGVEQVIGAVQGFPAWFDQAFGSGPATLLATIAGTVKDLVVGAIDLAGFAVRNMADLFGIALLHAGKMVDWLLGTVALLPTNLGRIADFVGGNWLELMTAPFKTLGKVITALASSFVDFLKNPAGGVQFNLDGIFDEYKKLAAKLPELVQAQSIDISADVAGRQASIGRTEADYQARLGKPFEAPAVATQAAGNPVAAAVARVAGDKAAATKDVAPEIQKFAADLAEKTKSPLEKFVELMDKADQAFAAGLIDQAQYDKASQFAAKESGIGREVKLGAAVEFGSREANSTVASALAGRAGGVGSAEKIGQQQIALMRQQLDETRRANKARDKKEPPKEVHI